MNWRFLPLPLVLCVPRVFGSALAGDLIAHYRFDTNGSDSLGRSPPFVVTNGDQSRAGLTYTAAFAVSNAPFTNGVLYVNGRYEANGHFVNYLGTAPIKDLRYGAFTVGFDFYPLPKKRSRYNFNRLETKLDSWTRGRYTQLRGVEAGVYNTDNILTGGYSSRWIGFNREDGLLNLTLNNQAFAHRFKDVAVKPGRWHNLICSVDLQRGKILTMFDGHLLETITLPVDFKLEVVGGPGDATEREFTFANYSNGSVFFGYAAHLKILGRALAESEAASLFNESFSERPTFPGDQSPWPSVILLLVVASLVVSLFLWLRIRRYRAHRSQVPKPP